MNTKMRFNDLLPKRNTFIFKDIHGLQIKRWKVVFYTNEDQKREGVAILIADKIDFKPKIARTDK